MRTTLEIDDAVLAAAKSLARDEGVSLGAVISRLARKGLVTGPAVSTAEGFPVFEARADATPITLEIVNNYRDGD